MTGERPGATRAREVRIYALRLRRRRAVVTGGAARHINLPRERWSLTKYLPKRIRERIELYSRLRWTEATTQEVEGGLIGAVVLLAIMALAIKLLM